MLLAASFCRYSVARSLRQAEIQKLSVGDKPASAHSSRFGDDRALMEDDLPVRAGSAPDRGAPREPVLLAQGVGDQIVVRGDLAAVEVVRLPAILLRSAAALF